MYNVARHLSKPLPTLAITLLQKANDKIHNANLRVHPAALKLIQPKVDLL
jgi:hypothetical protein